MMRLRNDRRAVEILHDLARRSFLRGKVELPGQYLIERCSPRAIVLTKAQSAARRARGHIAVTRERAAQSDASTRHRQGNFPFRVTPIIGVVEEARGNEDAAET